MAETFPPSVEKGVPLPRQKRRVYPWDDLDVGDSFFVAEASSSAISSSACSAGKRLGMTFRCRAVTENNVHGVRVWRVE